MDHGTSCPETAPDPTLERVDGFTARIVDTLSEHDAVWLLELRPAERAAVIAGAARILNGADPATVADQVGAFLDGIGR